MIIGKNSEFIIQRILSCFILCAIPLFMCSQHLVGASRGNLASHSPVKETSEKSIKQEDISKVTKEKI